MLILWHSSIINLNNLNKFVIFWVKCLSESLVLLREKCYFILVLNCLSVVLVGELSDPWVVLLKSKSVVLILFSQVWYILVVNHLCFFWPSFVLLILVLDIFEVEGYLAWLITFDLEITVNFLQLLNKTMISWFNFTDFSSELRNCLFIAIVFRVDFVVHGVVIVGLSW